MEFLSIDHINGDGYIDRRLGDGDHIWNQLKRNKYPNTFQILCFNCHNAKTHYGYCPHSMLNNRRFRKQLLPTVFKDANALQCPNVYFNEEEQRHICDCEEFRLTQMQCKHISNYILDIAEKFGIFKIPVGRRRDKKLRELHLIGTNDRTSYAG